MVVEWLDESKQREKKSHKEGKESKSGSSGACHGLQGSCKAGRGGGALGGLGRQGLLQRCAPACGAAPASYAWWRCRAGPALMPWGCGAAALHAAMIMGAQVPPPMVR